MPKFRALISIFGLKETQLNITVGTVEEVLVALNLCLSCRSIPVLGRPPSLRLPSVFLRLLMLVPCIVCSPSWTWTSKDVHAGFTVGGSVVRLRHSEPSGQTAQTNSFQRKNHLRSLLTIGAESRKKLQKGNRTLCCLMPTCCHRESSNVFYQPGLFLHKMSPFQS